MVGASHHEYTRLLRAFSEEFRASAIFLFYRSFSYFFAFFRPHISVGDKSKKAAMSTWQASTPLLAARAHSMPTALRVIVYCVHSIENHISFVARYSLCAEGTCMPRTTRPNRGSPHICGPAGTKAGSWRGAHRSRNRARPTTMPQPPHRQFIQPNMVF